MRVETYKCGSQYEVAISVPTTEKEYDELAKKPGQCVIDAVDHTVYHSTLGDVRSKVVALIEKRYETKRREIGTGKFEGEGEDRTEVTKDEPFEVFLNRVAAEKKLNGDKPFADIFKAVSVGGSDEEKFDPSATARQPGKPPKLPNYYADAAKKIITGNHIPAFSKRYAKILGKELAYDKALNGDALNTAIGWAAREMKLAEERAQGIEAFTGKV